MYAMGQRAGTGFSIAMAITGGGLLNAVVSRFGNVGRSIFQGINFSTGTVWDSIKATANVYKGSILPRSFELATKSGRFWVHGRCASN